MKFLPAIIALESVKGSGGREFIQHMQNGVGERFRVHWKEAGCLESLTGWLADRDGPALEIHIEDGRYVILRDGEREVCEPETLKEAQLAAGMLMDHYAAMEAA